MITRCSGNGVGVKDGDDVDKDYVWGWRDVVVMMLGLKIVKWMLLLLLMMMKMVSAVIIVLNVKQSWPYLLFNLLQSTYYRVHFFLTFRAAIGNLPSLFWSLLTSSISLCPFFLSSYTFSPVKSFFSSSSILIDFPTFFFLAGLTFCITSFSQSLFFQFSFTCPLLFVTYSIPHVLLTLFISIKAWLPDSS